MSEQEIRNFASAVATELKASITDEVFLRIESSAEWMRQYLRLVEAHGLDRTNQVIGKAVRCEFSLQSSSARQPAPRSILILSHQILE